MGSWTYERSAAAADVPLEASGCAVACWHSISGALASPIPVNRSCDRSSSHPHTGQMACEPGPSSNTKYPQHGQGIQIRLVDPFVDGAVRGGVRASVDREVHLECSRAQRMPEGDVRPLNRSDLRQHIKRQPQLVERKIVPILVDADELDSGKSARARSRSALVLSHDSARSESAIVPYSLSLRLGTTIAEPRDRIRTDATYVRDCRGSHHWCSCAEG